MAGLYFEDFSVGLEFRHPLTRTVTWTPTKKDMPKDARAHWDETGKFDKYFSPKPGEGD